MLRAPRLVALALVPLLLTTYAVTALAPDGAPAPGAVPAAGEWLRAARTGEPLALDVDGVVLRVSVHPNADLLAAGLVVRDERGEPVDMAGTHALAGSVVGEPASWVRVMVHDGMVWGHVVSASRGAITLAPLATGGSEAWTEGRAHAAGLLPSMPFEAEDAEEALEAAVQGNHDLTGCLQLTPHGIASPIGLTAGWPLRTLQVSIPVDGAFVTEYGSSWAAVATGFVNSMDGFYRAQIGLALQVVDMHSHAASAIPGTDASTLLASTKSHYAASHAGLSREATHLFTGRDLSGVVGLANCIGGAGSPNTAYTVSKANRDPPSRFLGFVWFPDMAVKIAVHEVGHILSAHHHYSSCVERAPQYNPFYTLDACTIMINDIGLASLQMSVTNRLVTRGWADAENL